MGLPLRITYNDQDYVYQILDSKIINQYTTELQLIVNGEKVALIKNDQRVWVQKDEQKSLDPDLVQALGRSVSLRLRM